MHMLCNMNCAVNRPNPHKKLTVAHLQNYGFKVDFSLLLDMLIKEVVIPDEQKSLKSFFGQPVPHQSQHKTAQATEAGR